jgi:hypothetical protein
MKCYFEQRLDWYSILPVGWEEEEAELDWKGGRTAKTDRSMLKEI